MLPTVDGGTELAAGRLATVVAVVLSCVAVPAAPMVIVPGTFSLFPVASLVILDGPTVVPAALA